MAPLLPAEPITTYPDALRRLLSLADFERMAGIASPIPKDDLGRMRELTQRAGGPPASARIIHIAGTKGKGSVAAVATSILRSAGLRVVTFTSPHLHTFRERLRLDGDPIDEPLFTRTLSRVWPHARAMAEESPYGPPSTFEVLTAMAFQLARDEGAGLLVLEVGLGGRLDSTNVVDAHVDVITSLSLDHTEILGHTIADIAREKAGIIKTGVPVLLAEQPDEAMRTIAERADASGARLLRAGRELQVEAATHDLWSQRFSLRTPLRAYDLDSPLLGAHQRENVALAVGAVEAVDVGVSHDAVVAGVRNVAWDGRFQVLAPRPGAAGDGPAVVVDGAHNPHSMARLRETVAEYIAPRQTYVVFGCSGDKDLDGMVSELRPLVTQAVVCASRHPRAAGPERTAQAFARSGIPFQQADGVAEAIRKARARCGPGDLVLVTGSLFVVAEALESWYGLVPEQYPELDPRPRFAGSGMP